MEDVHGHRMELRYLRDVEGREVDLVVIKDRKPLFGVEVKSGAKEISRSILYFRDRVNIPVFYQTHFTEGRYVDKNITVLPFPEFCRSVLEGV